MLLKYEFRKTRSMKLILGVAGALFEILFLIGLYTEKSGLLTAGILLLTLLSMVALFILGIQSLVTLNRDLNSPQSSMLFMVPRNSYQILGAKILECTISLLAAGLIILGLGTLDVTLLVDKMGSLKEALEELKAMISMLTQTDLLTFPNIAAFLFAAITSWLGTVMSFVLAFVTFACLRRGKKANGLLSLLFAFALQLLLGWLTGKLPSFGGTLGRLWIICGAELIISALEYWLAAKLMERRLSV